MIKVLNYIKKTFGERTTKYISFFFLVLLFYKLILIINNIFK